MPRSARSLSTAARSSLPSGSTTRRTSTPCAASACSRSRGAASPGHDPERRLPRRRRPACSRAASAACHRARCAPANVPCPAIGRSATDRPPATVPMPVSTASFIARMRCTRRAAASPVMRAGLAPRQADLFIGGDGELERHVRAAVLHAPDVAGMGAPRLLGADARPRPRSRLRPCANGRRPQPPDWDRPARRRRGRRRRAMMASAQGGVLPWCEHGSSVTYSVAPRAAAPARRSASVSAWGRPPGWVQPRPTMTPSFTTTAPTAGLGQVRPSPRRPSASASAMKRASSAFLIGSTSLNRVQLHLILPSAD